MFTLCGEEKKVSGRNQKIQKIVQTTQKRLKWGKV